MCIPLKGCRFVKNGGGRTTCKGKKGRKTSSRGKCGAGLKKGKKGRCVLKKGYRFGSKGRPVKARSKR